MARLELGNGATAMVADGDELVMERVFDAPRELVWRVLTEAAHIARWWGPRGTSTVVHEQDLRVGGTWRWANVFDGGEARMRGEYLEVSPPGRYVRTSYVDTEPLGPPAVETVTLEEFDGRTTVRHHVRFPTEDILAFALSTGMSHGVLDQFDRLADLLTELR
ncbi:MAG TPA: SRPBCC domain-containing protein [Pseudonocardiaceae bacterium]